MTDDRKTGSSQSGNDTCYQAVIRKYEIVDGVAIEKWVPISTLKNTEGVGIPTCHLVGELFASVGYQSYEQAQALCWWFLADWEARPFELGSFLKTRPTVRIQVYDFIYDIKTYHRDEDNITIG